MLLSRLRHQAPAPQITPTRLHAAAGLVIRGLVQMRPEVSDEHRIHQLLWMVQILHVAAHGETAFPNAAIAAGAGPRVKSLHKMLDTREGLIEVLDPAHLELSDDRLQEVVDVVLKRHAHQTVAELRRNAQSAGGAWMRRYVTLGLADTEITHAEIVADAANLYGEASKLDMRGRPRLQEVVEAAMAKVRATRTAA